MTRQIGPYEVLEELGRGGMGVVYRVRDPATGREAALKLILGGADADGLLRFQREAQAMATVNHPNVVRVHQLGRAPEGPFIVTELVEGRTLKELVRDPPEPIVAARIVQRLTSALEALHGQGILHRDLKPENVILRPDGEPVLLDFGLARDDTSERLTQTGQLLGTPSYMSPEQAEGDPQAFGPATDVYGMGAILFALLAGRPPFEGTLYMILAKVLDRDPIWPSVDRPVPPSLEAICQRAMAKRPTDRYASAESLGAALEAYLQDPDQAVQASRRGWIVGLAALLLLLAMAVGLLLSRDGSEPEDTRSDATQVPTDPLPKPEEPPSRRQGRLPLKDRLEKPSLGPIPLKGLEAPGFSRGKVRWTSSEEAFVVVSGTNATGSRMFTLRPLVAEPEPRPVQDPDHQPRALQYVCQSDDRRWTFLGGDSHYTSLEPKASGQRFDLPNPVRVIASELRYDYRHDHALAALGCSPTGDQLLTLDDTYQARVFRRGARGLEQLATLEIPPEEVKAGGFDLVGTVLDDGRVITVRGRAVGNDDFTMASLQVWPSGRGTLRPSKATKLAGHPVSLRRLPGPGRQVAVALSYSKRLVTVNLEDLQVQTFSRAAEKEVPAAHRSTPRDVVGSHRRLFGVSGSSELPTKPPVFGGELRVWSRQTREQLAFRLGNRETCYWSVDLSPDGTQLLVLCQRITERDGKAATRQQWSVLRFDVSEP